MAIYAITFARSARKELERLGDPRPTGCRKLEGAEDLWRIRIGDYRIIYSVDDSRHVVDISAIRHRSDAYR